MGVLRRKPLLALGLGGVLSVVVVVTVVTIIGVDAVPWDCCGWLGPAIP